MQWQTTDGQEVRATESWLHAIFLTLSLALCLLRFAYIRADFPNHSPWQLDQAKFTDEGWWASAAVRHSVLGHWQIAGDYNPAAAVPVWPTLLSAVFHFTGVSIVAARATNVWFSTLTVALMYLLLKRYGAGATAAAFGSLLLAASPFAFAFSRLATLDTMVLFEFCLLLWLASHARPDRLWPGYLLGAFIAVTLLTKTTAVVLLPAVLWLVIAHKHYARTLCVTIAVAGAGLGLYLWVILHSSYAADYHYFFEINAIEGMVWSRSWRWPWHLVRNGRWIDPILFPAASASLLLSLVWLRQLWRNPLFTASFLGFAGEAVFILRRQNDYAPRYFLVMVLPVMLILILTLQQLRTRNRSLTQLLAATLSIALMINTAHILQFLHHRQYQFAAAANSIQAILDADHQTPRILLGSSADQLALMTGIPALNDGYSSEDLEEKAARYQPGWYIGWNELDDEYVSALSAYGFHQVADFPVFDHSERNRLILYRLVPALRPGGAE